MTFVSMRSERTPSEARGSGRLLRPCGLGTEQGGALSRARTEGSDRTDLRRSRRLSCRVTSRRLSWTVREVGASFRLTPLPLLPHSIDGEEHSPHRSRGKLAFGGIRAAAKLGGPRCPRRPEDTAATGVRGRIFAVTDADLSVTSNGTVNEGTPPGAGGDRVCHHQPHSHLREADNVFYTLSGTATAGTDYTSVSGIASFAAGQNTVQVRCFHQGGFHDRVRRDSQDHARAQPISQRDRHDQQ